MLGAVPAMSIVVDLMNMVSFTIPHAKECVDTRVGPDRGAWIDRFDVTGLREELELDVFLTQRGTVGAGVLDTGVTNRRHCNRVAKYRLFSRMSPDMVPDLLGSLIRLAIATAIGGVIGLNREITQKPAGLRTHALVSLGSALMTVTALHLAGADPQLYANTTGRVIQGIVAGIGFIGGGVILHKDGRDVKGLTTAATIWVAAGLGISCAIGQWQIALGAVTIALVVLVIGRGVETLLHRHQPPASEREPLP